jgi:hypothetical protein
MRVEIRVLITFCGIPMFLAVPSRFCGIALNRDAVPMRPLDAEDISMLPSVPRRDIGRPEGGRDKSIQYPRTKIKLNRLQEEPNGRREKL